jgi:hypothetical protein
MPEGVEYGQVVLMKAFTLGTALAIASGLALSDVALAKGPGGQGGGGHAAAAGRAGHGARRTNRNGNCHPAPKRSYHGFSH